MFAFFDDEVVHITSDDDAVLRQMCVSSHTCPKQYKGSDSSDEIASAFPSGWRKQLYEIYFSALTEVYVTYYRLNVNTKPINNIENVIIFTFELLSISPRLLIYILQKNCTYVMMRFFFFNDWSGVIFTHLRKFIRLTLVCKGKKRVGKNWNIQI